MGFTQKLREGQEIGKLVLLAEARLGELFNQMPKQQGTRTDLQPLPPTGKKLDDRSEVDKPKPKLEVAAEMGFNKNQVAQFQKLADNPDAVQKAIDDRTDAKIWILKNQLGRRNLIPAVRIKIALLVEQSIAQKAKARQAEYHGNQYQSAPEDKCPQVQTPQEKNKIDRQNKTNYQLAKMAGENVHFRISLRETLKAR